MVLLASYGRIFGFKSGMIAEERDCEYVFLHCQFNDCSERITDLHNLRVPTT